MDEKPPGWFNRRPWLYVLLAFAILLAAWGALITIAFRNAQEKIPVPKHSPN